MLGQGQTMLGQGQTMLGQVTFRQATVVLAAVTFCLLALNVVLTPHHRASIIQLPVQVYAHIRSAVSPTDDALNRRTFVCVTHLDGTRLGNFLCVRRFSEWWKSVRFE